MLKRVSCKSDNSTLRFFFANSASLHDACLSQILQFKYAVWLPLRVFERLARFARSPTYLFGRGGDNTRILVDRHVHVPLPEISFAVLYMFVVLLDHRVITNVTYQSVSGREGLAATRT